jgi:uncharacterized damage-inducible protein DinB
MKDLLLQYVKYNLWANERLTDFICNNCTEEQAYRDIVSSFSSVRQTLLHIWGAESFWLLRLNGTSPEKWTWMEFEGTITELQKNILNNDRDWVNFIGEADIDFLSSEFSYKNLSGKEFTDKVSNAILHCMNHSTFHRGQLVTLLRQLGFTKLIPTDYVEFCRSV